MGGRRGRNGDAVDEFDEPGPLDARFGPIPDDPRQFGNERVDRDCRRRRRHDGHWYPDGDHLLHARHGRAHDHRWQGRRDVGSQARVRHRLLIYGAGSLTTAISQSLTVLIIGWSVLEGIGASLIMPAIVALVASNFGRSERPRAYGLIAASGAIAVAAGPLIGGLFTTYLSWRLVFASEVVIVIAILFLTRRMAATPPDPTARLDLVGTALSGSGLSFIVFGVLQAGAWGVIQP